MQGTGPSDWQYLENHIKAKLSQTCQMAVFVSKLHAHDRPVGANTSLQRMLSATTCMLQYEKNQRSFYVWCPRKWPRRLKQHSGKEAWRESIGGRHICTHLELCQDRPEGEGAAVTQQSARHLWRPNWHSEYRNLRNAVI